jgi:hypothetical protein
VSGAIAAAAQKIARLEALLSQIKERAALPRVVGSVVAAAAPAVAPPPPVAYAPPPRHQTPPMMRAAIPTPVPTEDAMGEETEVEVSHEVVEVDIDVDEPMLPLESGAQPVSLQSSADDEEEPEEMTRREQGITPADVAQATAANELEEPAPSSSRRPIAEEPAEAPYEEESAPRHTPPPESGKQVTAPSVHPPASSRKTSQPPPSLEGHTLIGGWREPGIPREAGTTPGIAPGGLRVPAPAAGAPPAQQAPAAGAPRLSPEATRADLPQRAAVGTMEGATPAFKPKTFGELLDATLEL